MVPFVSALMQVRASSCLSLIAGKGYTLHAPRNIEVLLCSQQFNCTFSVRRWLKSLFSLLYLHEYYLKGTVFTLSLQWRDLIAYSLFSYSRIRSDDPYQLKLRDKTVCTHKLIFVTMQMQAICTHNCFNYFHTTLFFS